MIDGTDDLEELLRDIGDDGPGRRLRRGAGFLLRSGDATMAVRCDPQENMRACVDATTTLLERARSALPPGGAPGSSATSVGPGCKDRPHLAANGWLLSEEAHVHHVWTVSSSQLL